MSETEKVGKEILDKVYNRAIVTGIVVGVNGLANYFLGSGGGSVRLAI